MGHSPSHRPGSTSIMRLWSVECGGAEGDSVIVELQEQTGCMGYIGISEIKAYSYDRKL